MESPNVYVTKEIWRKLSPPLRKALLKDFTYDVFDNRILWSIAEDMMIAENLGTKGARKLLSWLDAEVSNIVARESGLLHGDTVMPGQFPQQEFEVNKKTDYFLAEIQIIREAQKILRREGIIGKTNVLEKIRAREVPESDEEGIFEIFFSVFDYKDTELYAEGSLLAFVLYDYPRVGKIAIESIAFTDLKRV